MTFQVPQISIPFADYKWRWMEYIAVESFDRLDVLLGVTRAIYACEGERASSAAFNLELQRVQNDLLTKPRAPKLASKDLSRNLIRRQGRYWRGLGILAPTDRGAMTLTPLGRDFARGVVSPVQFVEKTVSTHSLPNPNIDGGDVATAWHKAGLSLRPLAIIVATVLELAKHSPGSAYITTSELQNVIVPLCIVDSSPAYLAKAIDHYRKKPSDFAGLPDCAPEGNDIRMLREHLLFLAEGQILVNRGGQSRFEEVFQLSPQTAQRTLKALGRDTELEVETVPKALGLIVALERERRNVAVVARPGQAKFRRRVLKECGSVCLLTGETVPEVLIACHIHEVWEGGADDASNGIPLRADLHTLFDLQKLRIADDGEVVLSPDIQTSPTYKTLPKAVTLPPHLNLEAVRRRFLYGKVMGA